VRGLPGTINTTLTFSQMLTQLGVSPVVSTNNHKNCLEISSGYALVFNTVSAKYRIVARDNITQNEVPLIINVGGKVVGGIFSSHKTEFANNNDINNYVQEYTKGSVFTNLFNNSNENDSYLFFTDPHTSCTEEGFVKMLGTIAKFVASIPFDFVLCGGDWLTNNDSKLDAKYKLGYVTSSFNKNVNKYYQLVGNHDNNYQGLETLTTQEIINIYNRNFGSNYYSFETKNTKYYTLDTGTDWDITMNTYRWQQIDWLATKLIQDDAKHSVVAMHIYWNNGDTLSDMATNLNYLVIAYNSKNSITLNGTTYDFSNTIGHIEYVISGHTHADKNDKIGTIPVFSTINASYGFTNIISFDMIFADYDNRRLYLIRQGSGSNRTFNLDTGELVS